tara:strand:- start:1257 stop:1511 length:255 start_codon:yes stop_codon:yes gene_type:complete
MMNDRLLPLPRDKEVLDFITKFIGENGWSPIIIEIAEGCGYSKNSVGTVAKRIDNLEQLGLVVRQKNTMRSIVPTSMLDELENK